MEAKIKNVSLSDETAWREAQVILGQLVTGYTGDFVPYEDILREVFSLRRQAFFERITSPQASLGVQQLIERLDKEQQDLLTPPIVLIRDLLEKPKPLKGNRRHH